MMREMGMRPSHPEYDDHGRKISDLLGSDDDSVLNKSLG
jgi:hypothetical protein